jgi:hypothetical protein
LLPDAAKAGLALLGSYHLPVCTMTSPAPLMPHTAVHGAADHDAAHVSSSVSSSVSSQMPEQHWVVQDILAERTSVSGPNEVLVVWKASWIPVTNMDQQGPVWQEWRRSPKWSSSAMRMQVMLAMEPGSQLDHDCERASAAAQHRPLTAAKKPLHLPAAHGSKKTRHGNNEGSSS